MQDIISFYLGKKIAVTGGSGYIGSAIIDALKNSGAQILQVSRKDQPDTSDIVSLKGDIKTKECWQEIVHNADIIFHLAGNTSVYAAANDPLESLQSTVLPVTQLISAAKERQHKPRVVFASTATIYGLNNSLPISEEISPQPVTLYDLHKTFAEKELRFATQKNILEGVSLRLANVYGPSSSRSAADDRGILNKITRMALQGQAIQLYGEGNYVRDYVHIDDVVKAFLIVGAVENVQGHSFNVATGKGTTVKDAFHMVVDQVARVTGKKISIDNVAWPENADPIELRNFVAETAKFNNIGGWNSTIELEGGIRSMIAVFQKNS
jgi:nucleoside-diphosphate-sugar epimerase